MSLKEYSSSGSSYSPDVVAFLDERSSSVKFLAAPKMWDRNRSKSWDNSLSEYLQIGAPHFFPSYFYYYFYNFFLLIASTSLVFVYEFVSADRRMSNLNTSLV